jgi:hypothetical protein
MVKSSEGRGRTSGKVVCKNCGELGGRKERRRRREGNDGEKGGRRG